MYDEDVRTGELMPAGDNPGQLQRMGAYASTRAEIDVQIATAKSYPRSMAAVARNLATWVASDHETAESCIYSLKRAGKTIQGPSIRFAEILAHAWGHMRVDAKIVDEGRDFITVRGTCHDLQSNNVWSQDVTRRITGSSGKRYDADLIGVTMMAAASIAQRDSVLKCIPAFIWRTAYQAALTKITGDVKTLADRRIKAIGQFGLIGVTPDQVFRKLGVPGINEITTEHMVELFGLYNAIRDTDTTIEAEFGETRVTSASLGGSPLSAAEDDGADAPAAQNAAPAAPQQPAAAQPAASNGNISREEAIARVQQVAAQQARQPAPDRRRGTRTEADADAPGRPTPAAPPNRAAPSRAEPPAARQEPAKASQQPPPARQQPPARAAAPAQAPPAANSGEVLLAAIRSYESDLEAASTEAQIKGIAQRYGDAFLNLSAEQDEQVNNAYDAAVERVKAEHAEHERQAAAAAYEAAQNGETPAREPGEDLDADGDSSSEMYDDPLAGDDVGEGTDDEPAAEKGGRSEAAVKALESTSDIRPADQAAATLWDELVCYMADAPSREAVMKRYDELEASGRLAQLPQDAQYNIRTARFRIKSAKAS